MFSPNRAQRAAAYFGYFCVTILFCFEFIVFTLLFWLISQNRLYRIYSLIASAICGVCWLLAYSSYCMTVFTNPGFIVCNSNFTTADQPILNARGLRKWTPMQRSNCEICQIVGRPERAHHCSVCERCVMRMDHHCPAVSNCIGFCNLKYFILFLGWTFVASLAYLSTSLPLLVASFNDDAILLDVPSWIKGIILMGAIISVGSTFLCLILFIVHLRYAALNMSSLELSYAGKNPYDNGKCNNLEQVFGQFHWTIIVPCPPRYPICDGSKYPVRSDWSFPL